MKMSSLKKTYISERALCQDMSFLIMKKETDKKSLKSEEKIARATKSTMTSEILKESSKR
jgi:hypothetical protein